MVRKRIISFTEARRPIAEPVTKFGGQPVWIEQPQWPLSRSTAQPMRFIAQVALDAAVFGETRGRAAYLFMTGGDEHTDRTCDAEGGENAVVVQPGKCDARTKPLAEGPTLCVMKKKIRKTLVAVPCEFAVNLEAGEDPDFHDQAELATWPLHEAERYYESLGGNKIGGAPGFLQSPEFPKGGPWRLLLQLESTSVPFHINFGDAGIGYAFINQAGDHGKFLWQSA
jgi:uncharacterized protein YwqG